MDSLDVFKYVYVSRKIWLSIGSWIISIDTRFVIYYEYFPKYFGMSWLNQRYIVHLKPGLFLWPHSLDTLLSSTALINGNERESSNILCMSVSAQCFFFHEQHHSDFFRIVDIARILISFHRSLYALRLYH